MKIKIGEGEHEITRPRLKKWLELQELQAKVIEAVATRNNVAKHIVSYVATALNIPNDKLETCSWMEVAHAYLMVISSVEINHDFPILNSRSKSKEEAWDYDGRTFFIWAHLLAKEYGWTLEYIAELEVESAIALMQEIAVADQLQKEWEWICSEIAYQSKDGFKELPRPDWMKYSKAKMAIPKVKIRKDMMPSGIVLRYDAFESGEGSSTV